MPKTSSTTAKSKSVKTAKKKTLPQTTDAEIIIPTKVEKTNKKTPQPKTQFEITELFKIWFNGWKNIFNFNDRASRFELWTFLLFNTVLTAIIQLKCSYYMSERFLRAATEAALDINTIEKYIINAEIIFYLSFIIPLIPTGSMLVRRMHDLNKLAWKNYMEPIFMGFVVLSMLFIALTELENTNYAYIALLLSICFCTILYSVGFYGIKVLIMTMFYRGNKSTNEFGAAKYNDDTHEEYALNISCFYFLFILTISTLWLTFALL